jgi:hypothetical protein
MSNWNLSKLLGRELKSDEIIEVLDALDLHVIYNFDRLSEGTDDCYCVSANSAGFELVFGPQQVLRTIFCYALPRDGFSPVDPSIVGVPFYSSVEAAQRGFAAASVPALAGTVDLSFLDGAPTVHWVKGQFRQYSVHYQFNASGVLELVTLSNSHDPAPDTAA